MAAKPKLTAEQEQLLLEVATARSAIPSDKDLAAELGITEAAVWARLKRLKSAISERLNNKHNQAGDRPDPPTPGP